MTKTMLLVSKEEADNLIDQQITRGKEMGRVLFNDHKTLIYISHVFVEPEMEKWTRRNISLMRKLFDTDENVERIQKFESKLLKEWDAKEKTDHLLALIGEQLTELEAIKGCLDLYTEKKETTEPIRINAASLSDEKSTLITEKESMPTESTWKKSIEAHPLGYALAIIIGTAIIVAGIMGWVQKVREDNLATKYETEKNIMKNDYEGQIRDLKTQINELQKEKEKSQPPKENQ
jgi:hypothetical protein